MFIDLLLDSLKNSILICGLVIIMMMMIESLNIESKGRFFSGLRSSRIGGVLVGAILGIIPGCMGGFATVSLYTHRMLSFGALVAMMIASCGDEAFVMLATIPDKSIHIFCLLFCIAAIAGTITDIFIKKDDKMHCEGHYDLHKEDADGSAGKNRHFGFKRAIMFIGTALFITALTTGILEHGHEDTELEGSLNLLSEEWMNVFFAALSTVVLAILIFASDHFVDEHLWHHVMVKHLPGMFGWTFGVLFLMGILLNFCDISAWISENTVLMILLATAVGIIPESGPHLIFITLYAGGLVPLPVLLASCISQDGHASLPLIAESKKSFLKAKAINCAVALASGFAAMLFQ